MRTVLVASGALLLGLALGWSLREPPATVTKFVYRDLRVSPKNPIETKPDFPNTPKPSVDVPKPEFDAIPAAIASGSPAPAPLGGDLPSLPAAGAIGPLAPATSPAPVADLRADEALARRIVLTAGGEIVSGGDARDATGKMGRSLVAELSPSAGERLEAALRRSLGDRIILSDAGFVAGSNAETRKAEDALLTLHKQRDQARNDFLPNAPVLLDIEDSYQRQERLVAELRRLSGRKRLSILIRPGLGS